MTVASSQPDAALYVYLSAVSPEGERLYLTEGQLRFMNRKPARSSDAFPGPFGRIYTFAREDARPMPPGVPAKVSIRLLPVSALIPEGYSLQVAIAGHDADTFARYPETGDAKLTIYHLSENPSFVEMPYIDSGSPGGE